MGRKNTSSRHGEAVPPALAEKDAVVIAVSGVSTISNPEARELFDEAVQKFGERMFREADLQETEHRDDTSDVPQFTTRMIVRAEARAREIEVRTVEIRHVPRSMIAIAAIHFVVSAALAVAGGAWVATSMAGSSWIFDGATWGVVSAVLVAAGVATTILTIASGNKGKTK